MSENINVNISPIESIKVIIAGEAGPKGESGSSDWGDLTNGPSSTPEQIDQAIEDSHTHSNKESLDLVSGTNTGDASGHENLEPSLPSTPDNPEYKVLNGNREWVIFPVGSGSYASNIYFTTIDSDIDGYKVLSGVFEAESTELAATIPLGEYLLRTYLLSEQLDVNIINAGSWYVNYRAKVDSSVGITKLKFEVFVRHVDNSETVLFASYSPDLNILEFTQFRNESIQPSFSVVATDRLGVRIYGYTEKQTGVTITTAVGDGNAAYFNTPLAFKHSQLRDLNGDEEIQHITSEDRTKLNNLSGTNTGDQVGDGITITGLGTIENPFVANVSESSSPTDENSIICQQVFGG